MSAFSPDVVAAVLAHMNGDHTDDSLVIVRANGQPRATAAVMTGLDERSGLWEATVDGAAVAVRIDWSHIIEERKQIRQEIVKLYEAATA